MSVQKHDGVHIKMLVSIEQLVSPGLHTPSPWQAVHWHSGVQIIDPQLPHSAMSPASQAGSALPPVHSLQLPASSQVLKLPHSQPVNVVSPGQQLAPTMHSLLHVTPPSQLQKPSVQAEPAPQSESMQHCVSGMQALPHSFEPGEH